MHLKCKIMMDEKARIGFLSAILKLNPEEIKETQILNTNLRKQSEKEKLGILDVRILDFKLFEHEPEFYSCFHIREDSRHFLYTDKLEFHVLELPKFPKELKEDRSDIELWGRVIRAERKEDFDMFAEKNTYIRSAYQHLQVISQDEEKRLELWSKSKSKSYLGL